MCAGTCVGILVQTWWYAAVMLLLSFSCQFMIPSLLCLVLCYWKIRCQKSVSKQASMCVGIEQCLQATLDSAKYSVLEGAPWSLPQDTRVCQGSPRWKGSSITCDSQFVVVWTVSPIEAEPKLAKTQMAPPIHPILPPAQHPYIPT